MRIAIGQINTTVGALRQNMRKVLEFCENAQRQQASLVIFPELCLTGYPPRDLLNVAGFLDEADATLQELVASVPPGITGPSQIRWRNEEEMYPPAVDTEAYYLNEILRKTNQIIGVTANQVFQTLMPQVTAILVTDASFAALISLNESPTINFDSRFVSVEN